MATYWENSCSFGLRYVSWYKYLIVSLVFSHLGFWSGNLFLIAPFPDLCLLVPFYKIMNNIDKIDKDKLFAFPTYTVTRGHQFKLAKKQHRLKIRSNSFSLRVIDSWNALPEHVVMAPSLNCFKLNHG